MDQMARQIGDHSPVHDVGQQAVASVRADRDEIRSGLGVVVSLQAGATVAIEIHADIRQKRSILPQVDERK